MLADGTRCTQTQTDDHGDHGWPPILAKPPSYRVVIQVGGRLLLNGGDDTTTPIEASHAPRPARPLHRTPRPPGGRHPTTWSNHPIVVDRHGQILDGKVRKELADRHGLFCPQVFVDGDTSDLRVTLNMYRRQLSQKQVRKLIAWELAKTPHHSDRRIAARVGCDKNTVGKVRAFGESHQSPREGVDGKTRRRPTIVHAPTPMLARQTQALLDDVEQLPEGVVTQRKLRSMAFQEKILAEASQPVAQLPANTPGFSTPIAWNSTGVPTRARPHSSWRTRRG